MQKENCVQNSTLSSIKNTPVGMDSVSAQDFGEVGLFVSVPTLEAAHFLASDDLGIGRRTRTKLVAGRGATGVPLLQIRGTPIDNATACFLVQEAMWISRIFTTSSIHLP